MSNESNIEHLEHGHDRMYIKLANPNQNDEILMFISYLYCSLVCVLTVCILCKFLKNDIKAPNQDAFAMRNYELDLEENHVAILAYFLKKNAEVTRLLK
ncbi:unnamed protein product [Bursaphelenchus okinawaensis]|uniref:Uncharacterized protein n=1 Tax=Bursaphelenchus okinawaensis TaxID=465554 RepID=A0A811JWL0_9BILA|nr:unnamed protein product [Bursaphelenchus okinawaensis]CAG9086384.1 unnamed protein product [Bursaphelenchus okinawaensis]